MKFGGYCSIGAGMTIKFSGFSRDGKDLGSRYMYANPIPVAGKGESFSIIMLDTEKSVQWASPGSKTPGWNYSYGGTFRNDTSSDFSFQVELGGFVE